MAKVIWKDNIRKKVINQAQRGFMNGTNRMFNRSQHYTPFDDGELTSGARISSVGAGTDELTVVISYGNDAHSAQYALLQHENLLYRHRSPEQAKFLERAFIEEAPMMEYYVANTIKT